MKKKKILVICPFPEKLAAGQRFKYEQYFDYWKKNNFDIKVSSFMSKDFYNIAFSKGNYFQKLFGVLIGYGRRIIDIFRLNKYDIIYIFMWVTPFGTSFFERVYVFLSNKIIYDIEDNIHQKNYYSSFRNFFSSHNKIIYLIKMSDHVITSSPYLNQECLKINKSKCCTYISSSIDTKRFKIKNSSLKETVLGWTGTHSSKKYLELLKPIFLDLNRQIKFKLIIISNFTFYIPNLDIVNIKWNKKNEISDLHKIDIGLYPLDGKRWVDGKSGLKALQYMAIGVPVVASNFGINNKIIDHSKNGYLVNSKKEWIYYLKKLIINRKLRYKIGKKSRHLVMKKYSTDVIKIQYLKILQNL